MADNIPQHSVWNNTIKNAHYNAGRHHSCCYWLVNTCRRKKEPKARTVWLGCPEKCKEKYPRNAIKNQKYNIFTFVPGVLYQQFKLFLNLYFLVVSCSQFVSAVKIGYLYTYLAPLGFVLAVTVVREAVMSTDDICETN